jgi:hypothetical protein
LCRGGLKLQNTKFGIIRKEITLETAIPLTYYN